VKIGYKTLIAIIIVSSIVGSETGRYIDRDRKLAPAIKRQEPLIIYNDGNELVVLCRDTMNIASGSSQTAELLESARASKYIRVQGNRITFCDEK